MRTLTDVFTPGAPTLPEGLRTLAVSPDRELEPGMTVRVSFTFRNQGGAPATGVRVRFNVPEGLVYLVGTGRLDGAELDDEQGNCPLLARAGADIGDVAPAEERRIELSYSVAGAIENGSAVEIQAAVAAFEIPPVGSNIVRLVARSRPALENPLTGITIESRDPEPAPGSEATVTVRIHNAGESSAHDLVVVAPVPEHTAYVPNSVRVNGRELERDLPAAFDRVHAPVIAQSLPASGTCTLQYRVRIDDPLPDETPIVARAAVASQEAAAFTLEPSALHIRSRAHFEDERTALVVEPSGEAAPGSRVTLRLRAYNAGTAAAQSAAVTLTLPDGLMPVRGGVCVDGQPVRERKNGGLTYELGAVRARESVEFSAEAIVGTPLPDGSQLHASALLRFDGGERLFERTIAVRSQPHLSPRRNGVERSGSGIVRPGEECEATIAIANDGSAAASDVVLHLHADPALDDVRVYEKNARLDLENDTVDLGSLEPFTSRKLTMRARLRTPYADRSDIRFSASLHAQEFGEVQLGHANWQVDSHPVFSAQSSALSLVQDDVFRPNQLADVFVRLRNEGTDSAQNVRLRLYISPEARLESVEGATRERSTLAFGEIPPGASAEARLGVRLLRGAARAYPVTIEAVLTADAMLPVQLGSLAIVTAAEPDFAIGALHTQPEEAVEAGEEIEFTLHVRNSGDGTAARARISLSVLDSLIYVPNSTTVNGLPVRDAGAQSPLMHERGLVLTDIDPGVEATIRWREVVNNSIASGESIRRAARIAYDGERTDEIAAHEIKVRCAPAFGNSISGLPFGLDGMLGPGSGGAAQRALSGEDFVELPPATPVRLALSANGNGVSHSESVSRSETAVAIAEAPEPAAGSVQLVAAFDRERLQRVLRFLGEARFPGLMTHLFAVRAFLPDAAGPDAEQSLQELREALHESLDRLFIKLRLPHYVIAARDLETPAARSTLETLLRSAGGECAAPLAATVILRGSCDTAELHARADRLSGAPLGTAPPWAALARLIPAHDEAMAHYRGMLSNALDELAGADPAAFSDALQRRPYPVLDAALDVVRAQLNAIRA